MTSVTGITAGIAVDKLRWLLTNKEIARSYGMERQADYRLHSDPKKYSSSIFLQPRHSTNQGASQRSLGTLAAMTDAIMLFAVKLDNTTRPPRPDEWNDMIRAAPHEVSSVEAAAIPIHQYHALLSLAKIQGLFTGSCLLIMSLPIWFWGHLEPNSSYQRIGIVRSAMLA